MASKSCKAGKDDNAIFRMHSLGLNSGRDYLAYNSEYENMCDIAESAVEEYERIRALGDIAYSSGADVFKWNSKSKESLKKDTQMAFSEDENIRPVMYRPFFPQWVHWDDTVNSSHYQLEKLFPTKSSLSLSLDRRRAEAPFTATAGTSRPDELHSFAAGGQTFTTARFTFRTSGSGSATLSDAGEQRRFQRTGDSLGTPQFSRDGLSVRKTEGGVFGADGDSLEQSETECAASDDSGGQQFSQRRSGRDLFASPICLPPEFARGCL